MKSRIRNRMSHIQQEVRAWLCGWGPPLDEAQAHKLIAEVQGIQKNILSPSQFGERGNLKVCLDTVMVLGLRHVQVRFIKTVCYTVQLPFNIP